MTVFSTAVVSKSHSLTPPTPSWFFLPTLAAFQGQTGAARHSTDRQYDMVEGGRGRRKHFWFSHYDEHSLALQSPHLILRNRYVQLEALCIVQYK